jgi:hypothetical protein
MSVSIWMKLFSVLTIFASTGILIAGHFHILSAQSAYSFQRPSYGYLKYLTWWKITRKIKNQKLKSDTRTAHPNAEESGTCLYYV